MYLSDVSGMHIPINCISTFYTCIFGVKFAVAFDMCDKNEDTNSYDGSVLLLEPA